MPRITHVTKAQPRYRTAPVIDPETGQPKRTPVMRDGVQRTTKHGKPIFMAVTVADKTQPLPPYTCDFCTKPIEVGTPYKHISPKSGPYGGRKRTRHEGCPSWQVWEYSNSLSAQLAQIEHDFWNEIDDVDSPDDVSGALNTAAEAVREIAAAKSEGADNIEEGFGHETESSTTLRETAEALEGWADEIEAVDVPDIPECGNCSDGQAQCVDCNGDGEVEVAVDGSDVPNTETCEACNGDGTVECEDCNGTGEDLDTWRETLQDELSIVGESPV